MNGCSKVIISYITTPTGRKKRRYKNRTEEKRQMIMQSENDKKGTEIFAQARENERKENK